MLSLGKIKLLVPKRGLILNNKKIFFCFRWDSRSPSPTYNYNNRRPQHRSPPKRKQLLDPVARIQNLSASFRSYQPIIDTHTHYHTGGEGGGEEGEGGGGEDGGFIVVFLSLKFIKYCY